jgi:uncharacterized membrane protein YidH (DUF202 family)
MLALVLIVSLIPPTEHRAELELRTLVCAFLALVGAVSLFGGYWLFANSQRAPRNNTAVATFFTGFGVVLIALIVMLTVGPWRLHHAHVFPIHAEPMAPAEGP